MILLASNLFVYNLIIIIFQIEDTKQAARSFRKMEERVYKQPESKKAEKFLLIKLDDETSALGMQTQLN